MTSRDALQQAVMDALAPPSLVINGDDQVIFAHGDLRPMLTAEAPEPPYPLAGVLAVELQAPLRDLLACCRRQQPAELHWTPAQQPQQRYQISARPAATLGEASVVLSVTPVAGEPLAAADTDTPQQTTNLSAPEAPRQPVLDQELRQINEALNRNSRRLELAWEAVHGGVLEHRIPIDARTYISDRWAQVLGYQRHELPPLNQLLEWLAARTHEQDQPALARNFRRIMEHGEPRFVMELRLRHREGHWIWVRKIAEVLQRDPQGRPNHLLRMMIDISDFKETEASLKESELRFREMADGLPLMVWVHDEHGNQELVNQAFCDFFGLHREEASGDRWQMLVHPEDAEVYTREFNASIAQQRAFAGEARVRHADGSWRWLKSWSRPRLGPNGEFRGLVGTSVDITEQRRMLLELRDSEERFRTLADNISQLAWMAHGTGYIFWFNKRWYDYTGTGPEQMQGWGRRSVHHPEYEAQVVAKFRDHMNKGEVWEDTFPLRGQDGQYRWFLSRAIPIHDPTGAVVRWFGTNTDVTELREVEEKLREADRQKDEFIAMLGHELRNPLASIRTASELLGALTRDHPQARKTNQLLERQTAHMARLLDGLLDISRIIRGKIRLQREVLDLQGLCRDVMADFAEGLGQRRLRITADLKPGSTWVRGDRVRLAQVISNLLSNSVKYTDDGGHIELSIERQDQRARIRVRDNGMGVEADLLPHVFEIFRQSHQSIDRTQGGLGLGLALVKTLTELHGGSVHAHSDGPDRGAEFVIELPAVEPPSLPQAVAPAVANRDQGRRVVLIEDNLDSAEVLRQLLELSGHQVTVTNRGEEGLAVTHALQPDVVISDLGLPGGMNGFDVARAVRSDATLRQVKLVALSGYGRPEDKKRSAEVGFDVHLTKPVDFKTLEQILMSAPVNRGAGQSL